MLHERDVIAAAQLARQHKYRPLPPHHIEKLLVQLRHRGRVHVVGVVIDNDHMIRRDDLWQLGSIFGGNGRGVVS